MAHLTLQERIVISEMLRAGHSQAEVAAELGRDGSVISRERSRNFVNGEHYHPLKAERRAKALKARPSVVSKLEDSQLFSYVSKKLLLNWSP
ncbi:helix-turn-helix domain-containing protein [Novipirellula sp.]|uniref:helix-turn-helix domain-containing protein n=1 Tax=Novipirellula sp. TaxID=2795430 RepID=UPI003563AC00